MVSFLLFTTVAAGATTAVVSALKASHSSQQRVDAAGIAQADISNLLAAAQAGNAPVATPESQPAVLGVKNEQFLLTRTVSPATGTCGAKTAAKTPVMFTVNVTVSQRQTNTFLARSDSVITC